MKRKPNVMQLSKMSQLTNIDLEDIAKQMEKNSFVFFCFTEPPTACTPGTN